MSFDPAAHQQPRMVWRKLFSQGRFAGYSKASNVTTLFSSGGRHWSPKALPSDIAVPEINLQDKNGQRLFHGDVIELAMDGSIAPQRILCTLNEAGASFFDERGRPQSIVFNEKTCTSIGSIYGDIGLAKQFDKASRTLEMAGRFAVSEAIACAGSALATMSIVGAVQFAVLGTIGLILCCLAAFGGVMLYCLVKRRGQKDWLMRSRVLKMAPIVGLVMGVFIALVYATLNTLGVSGLSDPNQSSLVLSFAPLSWWYFRHRSNCRWRRFIRTYYRRTQYGSVRWAQGFVVLRWTRMMGHTELIHHILSLSEQGHQLQAQ